MSVMPLRCFSRGLINFQRSFTTKTHQNHITFTRNKFHSFVKTQIVQEPKYVVRLFSNNEFNRKSEHVTSKEKTGSKVNIDNTEVPKLGIFKRFKQMYRDYWYVLVPVHLVTSACWFGGFYYMAKSGVDVVALLQTMGFSETFTNPLKDSSMGYIAISYALYKIATPLRYTVTLGGTTVSINYLKEFGYIKPVPSKDQLKEMYKERRDQLKDTIQETREELRQRKDQLKERKDNIIGDYTNFKKELKDIKTKNIRKVVPHPHVKKH